MKKSLSIIIPIYNTPSIYLEKCLDDINKLDNRYDIEILLLNDGSTLQETIDTCKKYSQFDKFIYIPLQNGGVSSARNIGILKSNKDFMMFVDSDDRILKSGIDYFFSDNCSVDNDYYRFSFDVINSKNKVIKKYSLTDEFQYGNGVCWSKIFKSNIIKENNLLFDTSIKYGEDSLFLTKYLSFCKSKSTINAFIYQYRINNSNTSHRYNENVFCDFNKTLSNLINVENIPLIMLMFLSRYIFPIFVYHKKCKLKNSEKKKIINYYLNSNDFVYKSLIEKLDIIECNFYWKIYKFLLKHEMYKTMVNYDKLIVHIFKKYC